jgi:hypothetical protein
MLSTAGAVLVMLLSRHWLGTISWAAGRYQIRITIPDIGAGECNHFFVPVSERL